MFHKNERTYPFFPAYFVSVENVFKSISKPLENLVIFKHMVNIIFYYFWGQFRVFHKKLCSTIVQGIVKTSRFVIALFFSWLECSLSDIYHISFHFHIKNLTAVLFGPKYVIDVSTDFLTFASVP